MAKINTSNLVKVLAVTAAPFVGESVQADELQLEFGSFVSFEMAEQDVFIDVGDDRVKRIPAAEVAALMDVSLFGAEISPPFEPLNLNPTETYGKGIDLQMTLRQWLAASATGTYSCEEGTAHFNLNFSNLVPNSVYTIWNVLDADPPTDPWQTIMYPLGARDGSDAAFTTDADGDAKYAVSFEPCVQLSGTQTFASIAAAWHPDGKTHGASPGRLGVDVFAQTMAGLSK